MDYKRKTNKTLQESFNKNHFSSREKTFGKAVFTEFQGIHILCGRYEFCGE